MIIKNPFIKQLVSSFVDLLPIIVVILVFQLFIIKQPIPDVANTIVGVLLVALGLTFFISGLEKSLFPLGETMAFDFASHASLPWLLLFAFLLGFGSTIAEPSLTAIADKAASVAAEGGMIDHTEEAKNSYALGLRISVAISVGFAIFIGVIRIIKGWPLHYLIISGYCGVIVMTVFASNEIIGIAYDAGGVTTSTLTVPLVTALGVGLASAIKGRNPMLDGFGLIAFASLTPMIFVMGYGMII